MTRGWLIAGMVVGLAVFCLPANASAVGMLFNVDQVSNRLLPAPGAAVKGLDGIRRIAAAYQIGALTARERASLQPERSYHALFVPNDPQRVLQWNLDVINMSTAWDADQVSPTHGGDPAVVVAVLDTGLAFESYQGADVVPDLTEHVWTNTGEIANDGLDNDGDGYIDDVHGWDFSGTNPHPIDTNGHGTHVAGIISAATDNALATAGIAFNVTIMPLKVLNRDGVGSTAGLAAAVQYAVAHGANIINLSLGGDQDDPIFHQAIQDAVAQGVVVVGAAGNEGIGTVTYPALYTEVISVGAVQGDLSKAAYANYGPTLDLVAPGGNADPNAVYNGKPDGILGQTCTDSSCTTFNVMIYSGTSQAAAHVSAVAALLESCGATAGSVRSILTSSAHDLGAAGRDDAYGAGLLDAAAALQAVGCTADLPPAPGSISGAATSTAAATLVPGRPYPFRSPHFSWTGLSGATYLVEWKHGGTTVSNRQTATTFSPTLTQEGIYDLSVTTVDAVGRTSTSVTFRYRYRKPVVTVTTGTKITLLRTDLTTIRSLQPNVTGPAFSAAGGVINADQNASLFVSSQPRGTYLSIVDTKGRVIRNLQPFGPTFRGQLRVTTLQQRDATPLTVVATGDNGSSLAWYSAKGKLLGRNVLYAKYTQGLEVASVDLDGDGTDELIVSQVAGAEVRVYSAARQRTAILRPRGASFRQGWSVTGGDTDGNGREEIIATPHVPAGTAKVLVLSADGTEVSSWKMSGQSTTTPIAIQAADTDGDGTIELMVIPRRGRIVLQRWSVKGKLLKKISLPSTTDNSLSRL